MNSIPEKNKNIYIMLGGIEADVKTLVKGQEAMWAKINADSSRISGLEKNETVRVARAGVFGLIGGFISTTVVSMIRAKIGI